MPTLSRRRLLRVRRWTPLLPGLVASVTLLGCSGNPGLRSSGVSKMRTFLAVGDRPLPVVSGTPGSAIVADVAPAPLAQRAARSDGRISGRVYDMDGRPVPGASVRLAVGPAPAGRDARAVTDPSGAFTLRDLRPGSTYTLIAEWEGDDGLVTGRSRAASDETGVRIDLVRDATQERPALAERPSRISKVADRGNVIEKPPVEGGEDLEGGEVGRPEVVSRFNEEDLPPAPEAESLDASPVVESDPIIRRVSRPRLSSWQPVGGVRRASADLAASPAREREGEFDAEPPDGSGARVQDLPSGQGRDPYEDEGPSPLPPAVERWPDPLSRSPSTRSPSVPDEPFPSPFVSDPFEEEPRRAVSTDRSGRPVDSSRPSLDDSVTVPRVAGTPRGTDARPTEPTRIDSTPEPQPGQLVAVPDGYAPILLDDQPYEEPGPSRAAASRRDTPPPAPPRPGSRDRTPSRREEPPIDPFDEPSATATRPADSEVVEKSRAPVPSPSEDSLPDWAVAGRSPAGSSTRVAEVPPPIEAPSTRTRTEPIITPLGDERPVRRPVAARPSPPSPSMAAEAHTPRPVEPRRRPTWGEVAALASSRSGERKVAAVDPDTRPTRLVRQEPLDLSRPRTEVEPTCDYDSRLRRVLDFQLPDVNGKPTRFRDFDADLILLDFWGTWCQPCVRSIPHLVDLQKKLGGKTLVVVGIACEQDAPGQSAARVAKVAERLKVNYPLLLSRNDGSCPLQEALHVQAFPTMILLDREGRLLWRDQGATPATLSRLDRMISVATQVDGSKVRR